LMAKSPASSQRHPPTTKTFKEQERAKKTAPKPAASDDKESASAAASGIQHQNRSSQLSRKGRQGRVTLISEPKSAKVKQDEKTSLALKLQAQSKGQKKPQGMVVQKSILATNSNKKNETQHSRSIDSKACSSSNPAQGCRKNNNVLKKETASRVPVHVRKQGMKVSATQHAKQGNRTSSRVMNNEGNRKREYLRNQFGKVKHIVQNGSRHFAFLSGNDNTGGLDIKIDSRDFESYGLKLRKGDTVSYTLVTPASQNDRCKAIHGELHLVNQECLTRVHCLSCISNLSSAFQRALHHSSSEWHSNERCGFEAQSHALAFCARRPGILSAIVEYINCHLCCTSTGGHCICSGDGGVVLIAFVELLSRIGSVHSESSKGQQSFLLLEAEARQFVLAFENHWQFFF